jgi:ABC-type polysaccharide/polyol phosphate transport system ATPase subunit
MAIRFQEVSKIYSHTKKRMLLRGYLSQWLRPGEEDRFYALKKVSFAIGPGETVAVVGANGAGKSTLLSLVANLCSPDEGSLCVNGRIAALLELGSGFHPDLSGAENIFLNASLLGLSRAKTLQLYPDIVAFSGIGEFIEQPLRTYSAGMNMRLAFSVAVNVDPDILIIDEVLAVGDRNFQKQCLDKIFEFKEKGKTLLCVSHAAEVVQELCERALWLDAGELVMDGPVKKVMAAYTGREHTQAVGRTAIEKSL